MKGNARSLSNPAFDSETELHGLMLSSLEGNQKAYADFLERVAEMLRSYLWKSVNRQRVSSEQVEDLVQDVLLSIHQKRGTFRIDLPIMPWLFTIARYRMIDSYRSEGRKPLTLAFQDEINADDIADPCTQDVSCSKMDLETMLCELNEKQRRVLHLAKVEELPLGEIGTQMNMSLSSVKVTIHRAMAILKKNRGVDNEDQ